MASDPSFFTPSGASEESFWDQDVVRALQYDDKADDYGGGGYKAKDAVRIDYSVLSVAVMTLGLIMIVELARHKLDHVAHHKPFLKAVLEGVYEELATLGIVEFLLHIMAEYYEEYDKVRLTRLLDIFASCTVTRSVFLLFRYPVFRPRNKSLQTCISCSFTRRS